MNYLKNMMSQGASANFFIYQEQYKEARDKFDTISEKYRKLVEVEEQ